MDEKAFIASVERADARKFAEMLTRPDSEQELALRWHLGDERYQRMHQMALRRASIRTMRAVKGQVVVVHGTMGSELGAVDPTGRRTHLWINAPRIMEGQLRRLRLHEDGRNPYSSADDIRVTGMMKRHYGELLLALSRDWEVRAFCYDWRKDVRLAAAQLAAKLRHWFPDGTAVSFVAHGMGGLTVRMLARDYPDQWRSYRGTDDMIGRLVMLGTPTTGPMRSRSCWWEPIPSCADSTSWTPPTTSPTCGWSSTPSPGSTSCCRHPVPPRASSTCTRPTGTRRCRCRYST